MGARATNLEKLQAASTGISSIHYSRTTFYFNLTNEGTFARLTKGLKAIGTRPGNHRYIKKFTLFGYADDMGGQIDITFDLQTLAIVDARWRPYQNKTAMKPSREHHHLISDVAVFHRP